MPAPDMAVARSTPAIPDDLLQRLERASRQELDQLGIALPSYLHTPLRDPVESAIAWDLAGL